MTLTKFGKEAKKKMIDLDMTSSQLAERLGITNSYLTDIFKGNRKGKPQIAKIKKILGLKIDE